MLAPVEQIEDLFGSVLTQRNDAPVIEDPEAAREHFLEKRIEAVSCLGRNYLLSKPLYARTVDAVPLAHGRQADAQGRMGLPGAGRSKEQCDSVTSQEGVVRERLDLSPRHAGIELPVERLERRDFREAGETDPAFEGALPARIDLTLQR